MDVRQQLASEFRGRRTLWHVVGGVACGRVYGVKEHPDTLMSINNLAVVLWNQGKYEQAKEIHRRVLRLKKVLSKEHPDTLANMNNLAVVLEGQGKYEQAEDI
jgi:tetratricopeptide (TPR) repeat protein